VKIDRKLQSAPSPPVAKPVPSLADQQPMLFCPVCSLRLDQRNCKLFCAKCGYYLSCSDYY